MANRRTKKVYGARVRNGGQKFRVGFDEGQRTPEVIFKLANDYLVKWKAHKGRCTSDQNIERKEAIIWVAARSPIGVFFTGPYLAEGAYQRCRKRGIGNVERADEIQARTEFNAPLNDLVNNGVFVRTAWEDNARSKKVINPMPTKSNQYTPDGRRRSLPSKVRLMDQEKPR